MMKTLLVGFAGDACAELPPIAVLLECLDARKIGTGIAAQGTSGMGPSQRGWKGVCGISRWCSAT